MSFRISSGLGKSLQHVADFASISGNRTAQAALAQAAGNLRDGRTGVYGADLSSYLDTIPHDKMMA